MLVFLMDSILDKVELTKGKTILILLNQDVERMKFVRSIKTTINRDILKKGDVEYGTLRLEPQW